MENRRTLDVFVSNDKDKDWLGSARCLSNPSPRSLRKVRVSATN